MVNKYKAIYIFKGIIVICILALGYAVVDMIEIKTDHEPMRELPQCPKEKSILDCHYPKYIGENND